MGHFCRICGRVRANEKFTGRGHRRHICKDCQRRPRAEHDRLDRLEELDRFLRQSIISGKNQLRLRVLTQHPDPEVRSMAELILKIARVHPRRRGRIRNIARRHWPLFVEMATRLSAEWWDDFFVDHMGDAGIDWLREHYAAARLEPHGRKPCWCGSGLPYWDCCADRDEATAAEALFFSAGPAESVSDRRGEDEVLRFTGGCRMG